MRIGFVTIEFPIGDNCAGGLANYLLKLALSLKEMGHEPVVILASDNNEEIFSNGIEVHKVEINSFFLMKLFKLPIIKFFDKKSFHEFEDCFQKSRYLCATVNRLHKKNPFDLVQYASLSGLGLFHSKNISSVVRLSSREISVKRVEKGIIGLPDKVRDLFERTALKRFSRIFAPSKLIADEYSVILGKQVEVIHSPFVISNLDEVQLHLLDNKKYLLFFGNIAKYKGAITIANIIGDLLKDYPDLFFVFAGEDKKYKGKSVIKYIWENAEINRCRVLFTGLLQRENLYPLIKDSYGVVLPSHIDNFPNACLEARGFGKIVIGTRGASFDEMITDDEDGFLCDIDDPFSLRKAIDKLLQLNPEKKKEMEQKAIEWTEKLKPEIVVRQLINFYEQTRRNSE